MKHSLRQKDTHHSALPYPLLTIGIWDQFNHFAELCRMSIRRLMKGAYCSRYDPAVEEVATLKWENLHCLYNFRGEYFLAVV